MLARRLLALIAVLLVLLAIANAVAPRGSDQPASHPAPAPPAGSGGAAQASPVPATGPQTVTATLSADPSGRPHVVRAQRGDLVNLSVTAPVVGTVAVAGYDLLEAVDPSAPAEFHFIADRVGTFDVSLEEADAVIGRLRVRPSA